MTVQNTWMTLFMAPLDRDLPFILLRSCYIVLCQNRIVLCKKRSRHQWKVITPFRPSLAVVSPRI